MVSIICRFFFLLINVLTSYIMIKRKNILVSKKYDIVLDNSNFLTYYVTEDVNTTIYFVPKLTFSSSYTIKTT